MPCSRTHNYPESFVRSNSTVFFLWMEELKSKSINGWRLLQPMNRPLWNVPKTLKMIYHLLCYHELHLSGFGLFKAVINEAIGEDKSTPDTRQWRTIFIRAIKLFGATGQSPAVIQRTWTATAGRFLRFTDWVEKLTIIERLYLCIGWHFM